MLALNIFEIPEDHSQNFENSVRNSSRNRRGFDSSISGNQWSNQTFSWEIKYFDVNGTGDQANESNYTFSPINNNNLNSLTTSNKMTLNVNGPSTGGLGNTSVFAYRHIGGGNWKDYAATGGFHFMTGGHGTLGDGNVSDYFNIVTSGIDAWLNPNNNGHNSYAFGVYRAGNDFYLTYDFDENSLAYSSTPEPSTYVMTGALLCFIGFNQKSRKSLKRIFTLLSNKLNLQSYLEKLTRSESHS